MADITYKVIDIEDVYSLDKTMFNSNNHWSNGNPPNDYRETCDSSHTSLWMNKFHNTHKTIHINSKNIWIG